MGIGQKCSRKNMALWSWCKFFVHLDEIVSDKDINFIASILSSFQTSLRLSLRSSTEVLKFIELVALLLQEEQARECAENSGQDQACSAKDKHKGKK